MPPIISIENVSKSYASGVRALEPVNLEILKGEIFALLGPNGAGKTTLINIVCGIVTATSGRVVADGHDIVRDYRAARDENRPRAPGADHRLLRDRVGNGHLQPRTVRPRAESRLHRKPAARSVVEREARQPHHGFCPAA